MQYQLCAAYLHVATPTQSSESPGSEGVFQNCNNVYRYKPVETKFFKNPPVKGLVKDQCGARQINGLNGCLRRRKQVLSTIQNSCWRRDFSNREFKIQSPIFLARVPFTRQKLFCLSLERTTVGDSLHETFLCYE